MLVNLDCSGTCALGLQAPLPLAQAGTNLHQRLSVDKGQGRFPLGQRQVSLGTLDTDAILLPFVGAPVTPRLGGTVGPPDQPLGNLIGTSLSIPTTVCDYAGRLGSQALQPAHPTWSGCANIGVIGGLDESQTCLPLAPQKPLGCVYR